MADNMAKEIQFILYNLPDNSGAVQAIVHDETLFLTQKSMAELFGVEVNTINYHLKEIYSSNELTEDSTIRKIRTVQTEGNRQVERERAFYSLDAIISVGSVSYTQNRD
ncbi:MAG: cell filamentation protein Fic, partial [Muribaculaceae bacterium]|nr:cell filamentation protein Fic [Muribaculaceae bacterium]